jgi:WD40 repeat protein
LAAAKGPATRRGRVINGRFVPDVTRVFSPEQEAARQAAVLERRARAEEACKALYVLDAQKAGVASVAFSPDGKLLATGGGDGWVMMWDLGTGKQARVLGNHQGPAFSVAFSPDGKRLVSGGEDRKITLWNVETGEIVDQHEQQCPVHFVTYLADSQRVVSMCGRVLRWWKEGTESQVMEQGVEEAGNLQGLMTLEDGRLVVNGDEGNAAVVDPDTGETVKRVQRPKTLRAGDGEPFQNWIMTVAPAGPGRVVMSDASEIFLWDVGSGSVKWLVKPGRRFVAITPDEELLVAAEAVGVDAYDTRTGRGTAPPTVEKAHVNQIAMSRAGDRLAVASGGKWQEGEWKAEGEAKALVFDLKAMHAFMDADRAEAARKAKELE